MLKAWKDRLSGEFSVALVNVVYFYDQDMC
jgi:hypothetical protein